MELAVFSNSLDIAAKCSDTMANLATVHFQFGLARSSGSNTAAETREIISVAGQPGESIVELGEFDLKFAFFRTRASGENIENDARAIDNLRVKDLFNILPLAWRQ